MGETVILRSHPHRSGRGPCLATALADLGASAAGQQHRQQNHYGGRSTGVSDCGDQRPSQHDIAQATGQLPRQHRDQCPRPAAVLDVAGGQQPPDQPAHGDHHHASAQPVCRIQVGDTITVFFAETPGVPAEFVAIATGKIAAINEAYDVLRKARGFA